MTERFEVMRQGNMIVEEYYMRLMQLARFVVDPTVSDVYLIFKFGKNLNQNIYSCIGT